MPPPSSQSPARSWSDALADRSIRVYGEPSLVTALPTWFVGTEQPMAISGAAPSLTAAIA
jgi:hypothetical protein